MEPAIKVTRIKNRYHARCFLNGKIVDEMACAKKDDIGVICHIMLRWLHKLGQHISNYTDSARHRPASQRSPIGKIWYKNKLDEEKERRIITASTRLKQVRQTLDWLRILRGNIITFY